MTGFIIHRLWSWIWECSIREGYTVVVSGKHPVIGHEFLGGNLEGKDVIVLIHMIASSGDD